MIKYILIFVLFIAVDSVQSAPKTNRYVAFNISVSEKKLKAGGKGAFLITLTPQKGIHVNLTPPMNFTLDSSGIVAELGKIQPTAKETLLDASKPVLQPFVLTSKASPGSSILHGTLVYFYCSDSEGWCSKFSQPFDVKVTVVK